MSIDKMQTNSLLDESLFDRFEISTSLSKAELMRAFQMKPDLRKELPTYIKVIQDEKKLYNEELSSIYIDEDYYSFDNYLNDTGEITGRKQLAACLSFMRDFDARLSDSAEYWYCFVQLLAVIDGIDFNSEFYHSEFNDSYMVVKNFLNNLWETIESKLSAIANSLDVNVVNKIYDAFDFDLLKEHKEKCHGVLCESFASYFDSVPSRCENKAIIDKTISIIRTLDTRILNDRFVYPSLKQGVISIICLLRQMDDVIFPVLPDLTLCLKKSDRDSAKNVFLNYCAEFVLLNNIDKNTYSRIHSVEDDIAICKSLFKKYCNSCDENECTSADITLALSTLSESDYKSFRTSLRRIRNRINLQENLYKVCSIIAKSKELSKFKIAYWNLLSEALNLDSEIKEVTRLLENWNKVIDDIKRRGQWAHYKNLLYLYSGDIPTVDKIETFTCTYYSLTILNPDFAITFQALRDSIFNILALLEYVPEYQHNWRNSLTPKGEFLRDFFTMLPGDWKFGDETVDGFLKYKLNQPYGSNYGHSKSLQYISKCDKAGKASKGGAASKRISCGYHPRTRTESASQDVKSNAINLIREKIKYYRHGQEALSTASSQSEYEAAGLLFCEAEGYLDAKELFEKCEELAEKCRKDDVYDKACLLQEKDDISSLREAAELFLSIEGWNDSDLRRSQCLRRKENLEKEQTYNKAIRKRKNANTEKGYKAAAKLFKEVKDYKDAKKQENECEELAEVCRKDAILKKEEKLISGIKNEGKKDKETVSVIDTVISDLSTISGWKNADELLSESIGIRKQILFNRKLKFAVPVIVFLVLAFLLLAIFQQ